MTQTAPDDPDKNEVSAEPLVTLLAVGDGYWLYKGVEYLKDMVMAQGAYPFKVRCYVFEDSFEMNRFVTESGEGTNWRINPDIVERIRNENQLIELSPFDD
ncbi:hypothetical protein [Pseudorhodobacter sp.]|uniref:hypothetical protein n=1 Tax=Pseudorhodobacter sp. TaxID=1934400 RepID=UPI0026488D04|nr:hypothetical protein [Pseudorhodobacter sp.]MDN5787842.1 hypothetical protein [Pseudorhodobacter sp.]